jgi:hypothetical protein
MNADDFYEEFKNALDYLGLKWGEKAVAKVQLRNDAVVLSWGNREAAIIVRDTPK